MRAEWVVAVVLGMSAVGACGGDDDGGGASTGGASTGGASTGGASTGGASTGGASSGGTAGSDASTGGSAGSDASTGGSAGSDASTGGSAGDGSADDSSSGDAAGDSGSKQSAQIDPANGGTLSIDGAVLSFDANSIGTATTIEGSSSSSTAGLPRASDLRGKVYEFAPNGAQFLKPGMLTLPTTGSPPSGKLWYVAWLDTANNTWITLPTLLLATRVAAPVKHFTKFAILETNGAGLTTGCNPPAPCGGTLGSHYDLGGFCFTGTPPTAGSLPFCPTTSTSQGGVVAAGVLDFNSSAGTFLYSSVAATRTEMDMQKACVDALETTFGTTFATCEALEPTLGAALKSSTVCTGNRAVSCQCYLWASGGDTNTKTGTYSTASTNLTLTPTVGSPSVVPYCVQSSKLHFDDTASKLQFIYEP